MTTLTRKGPRPQPRVPFDPLFDTIGDTLKTLARRLGVSRATLYDYRRDGIPIYRADRFACRLGKHPSQIWGDWYDIGS